MEKVLFGLQVFFLSIAFPAGFIVESTRVSKPLTQELPAEQTCVCRTHNSDKTAMYAVPEVINIIQFN